MARHIRPIVIVDYDPAWKELFEYERAMLVRACGEDAFTRIEHVGSTAVPGLAAKPIIDIMPGVRSLDAFAPLIAKVASLGYAYVPEFERDTAAGPGMPFRRYFRKDVDGERAFHLHCVEHGGEFWRDHLLFRNHLRFHNDDLQAYAALKRRLAGDYNRTMFEQGIDTNIGYTDRKTELIEQIKAKARAVIARSTPIVIAEPDPRWPSRFEELRARITAIAGDEAAGIEHVGSTSVRELPAKPTIDIAIGVRSMEASRALTPRLLEAGYAKGRDNFPDWRYFDREDHAPNDNVRLHVVPFGGVRWNRYLLFRDYLRAHPEWAGRYAELKRALAAEFGKDRLGYVEGKSDFVELVQRRARFG
jgi:GrpB-like predicted nucleotidyltransferase (UPF0157 family)